MFRRIRNGVLHTAVIGRALLSRPRRRLLWRIWAMGRSLPDYFNQPLPDTMVALTPTPQPTGAFTSEQIRKLADAVAAWQFRSPLGICLRRSLLRYYFLQEAGVPVRIIFGARFLGEGEGGGIGGHAWLTFKERPYHERPADYVGFAVMYSYPPPSATKIATDKPQTADSTL